jgi:hypothetical protein
MSYGLNVEMHRQSELAKRYLAICHQILPCLSQEVRKNGNFSLNLMSMFSNKIKLQQHSNVPNK